MNETDLQQKRINDGEMFYKQILKNQRNELLKDTDKYMLVDFPITPENLELIKQYRQALRDFTANDYIIPEKPDFIK